MDGLFLSNVFNPRAFSRVCFIGLRSLLGCTVRGVISSTNPSLDGLSFKPSKAANNASICLINAEFFYKSQLMLFRILRLNS